MIMLSIASIHYDHLDLASTTLTLENTDYIAHGISCRVNTRVLVFRVNHTFQFSTQ